MSNVLSAAWFLLSVQVGNLPICKHFQIHWREWTLHFNFKCTLDFKGRQDLTDSIYTCCFFLSISTQLMEMQFLHYAKVDLFAKEVCRRASEHEARMVFSPEIFQPYSNEAAAAFLASSFLQWIALLYCSNEIFI